MRSAGTITVAVGAKRASADLNAASGASPIVPPPLRTTLDSSSACSDAAGASASAPPAPPAASLPRAATSSAASRGRDAACAALTTAFAIASHGTGSGRVARTACAVHVSCAFVQSNVELSRTNVAIRAIGESTGRPSTIIGLCTSSSPAAAPPSSPSGGSGGLIVHESIPRTSCLPRTMGTTHAVENPTMTMTPVATPAARIASSADDANATKGHCTGSDRPASVFHGTPSRPRGSANRSAI
mmetsp:Transcript_24969/g.87007  ORF Transcript_24969/g.87007 Transcript_24969/m.87007 type:complete len:243 (+) Transcript_24969:273-1001(+)